MVKHMKSFFSIILILCLTAVPVFSVSATTIPNDEIMPLYNNTMSARIYAGVSNNGVLTISYKVNGFSDKTTKIVITTYIEKKTLGLFWTRVDNGQPDNQWVDTIYNYKYIGDRTFKLSSTGKYRIKVTYKVYGSGGSADTIPCETEFTY